MPELPEVQTLINTLKKKDIFNSDIIQINVIKPKLLKNSNEIMIKSFLQMEKIISIERIGKYIIFVLTNDKLFSIHLRMEGKIIIDSASEQTEMNKKHIMFQLLFENNFCLNYFDTRMFGTLHIYNSRKEMMNSLEIGKIGLDPFDKKLTIQYLKNIFQKKKQAIKTTLLDQTIIAGIGNIYANEILFYSKINPHVPTNKINDKQISAIIKNTKIILSNAIKHNGTTIFSFKFDDIHSGSFQKFLKVHSKQKCPCCNKDIMKEKINGRGTYYCPTCQK